MRKLTILAALVLFTGLSFAQKNVVVPYMLKASTEITVDGSLDEWGFAYPLTHSKYSIPDSGRFATTEGWVPEIDDCSGNIYMMYDENYLYFAANVKDDEPGHFSDADWAADAIEIYIANWDVGTSLFPADVGWPDNADNGMYAIQLNVSFDASEDLVKTSIFHNGNEGLITSANTNVVYKLWPNNDGYILEGKIDLDDLTSATTGNTISFEAGKRLPMTWSLYDIDETENSADFQGLSYTPKGYAGWMGVGPGFQVCDIMGETQGMVWDTISKFDFVKPYIKRVAENRPVTIDGELYDWNFCFPLDHSEFTVPDSGRFAKAGWVTETDDCSGTINVMYDDEYLYFSAAVKDDAPGHFSDADWAADGIELYIANWDIGKLIFPSEKGWLDDETTGEFGIQLTISFDASEDVINIQKYHGGDRILTTDDYEAEYSIWSGNDGYNLEGKILLSSLASDDTGNKLMFNEGERIPSAWSLYDIDETENSADFMGLGYTPDGYAGWQGINAGFQYSDVKSIALVEYIDEVFPELNSMEVTPRFDPKDIAMPYLMKASEPITVDGDLDEWSFAYPLVHNKYSIPDSGRFATTEGWVPEIEDCSGTIYLMYDENYLYFAADVMDDAPGHFSDADWAADAIEIYIANWNIGNLIYPDERGWLDDAETGEYAIQLNVAFDVSEDLIKTSIFHNGAEGLITSDNTVTTYKLWADNKGYRLEGKIYLDDLTSATTGNKISFKAGERLPMTWSLYDIDETENSADFKGLAYTPKGYAGWMGVGPGFQSIDVMGAAMGENWNEKSEFDFVTPYIKRVANNRPVTIDADISEWGHCFPLDHNKYSVPDSGRFYKANWVTELDDCSGRIYMMYDDDYVYFAANIMDDAPGHFSDADWAADAVELYMGNFDIGNVLVPGKEFGWPDGKDGYGVQFNTSFDASEDKIIAMEHKVMGADMMDFASTEVEYSIWADGKGYILEGKFAINDFKSKMTDNKMEFIPGMRLPMTWSVYDMDETENSADFMGLGYTPDGFAGWQGINAGFQYADVKSVAMVEYIDMVYPNLYPVEQGESNMAEIEAFVLETETKLAEIDSENGTVTAEVAFDTELVALNPTIVISAGAQISPTVAYPIDGESDIDFTNPVTIRVASESGIAKLWAITVTQQELSAENAITGFLLAEQSGDAVIDGDNHTIAIEVVKDTDVKALKPLITISDFASVSPGSQESQDFTSPVTYTVTSQSGVAQDWVVTVSIEVSIDLVKAAHLQVYPNPFDNNVTIESGLAIESVRVMSIMGSVNKAYTVSGKSITIETDEFESGIYFINVKHTNGYVSVHKIVKK